MNPKRTILLALVIQLALSVAAGCARKKRETGEAAYRAAAGEALRLYADLHPLRASRLGLAAADSLLFTFEEEETRLALHRLARLDSLLSHVPAAGLAPRDVENARVMLHWARAEKFALEHLAIFRANPLLVVWMAEDALGEMPSRLDPPRPGEAEAYRKRLRRLPALFSSAARALRNPAEAHARHAVERLDSLAAGVSGIGALARGRYGESFDAELADARGSLLDFRRFVVEALLPASRGKLILGSENLSKIFLYDELLNADPNMLIAEAERKIARLAADRTSTARRIDAMTAPGGPKPAGVALPGGSPGVGRRGRPAEPVTEPLGQFAARIVDTLWAGGARTAFYGVPHGPKPEIRYPVSTRMRASLPKSPYLSPPALAAPTVVAGAAPFGGPSCRPFVLLSENAARTGSLQLRSALLCAAPAFLEADQRICEAGDSIAAVFASETYREGWRHLVLLGIMDELRRSDPELNLLLIDDRLRRLAQAIVVLRLHAGALTTESAARYLVETAGLRPAEAASDVLSASTSPSLAWPGISMILVERMLDRASEPSAGEKPRETLRKLLRQWRGLPLPVIAQKIERS